MKGFIFGLKLILLCKNTLRKFPVLKKYVEGSHKETSCVEETPRR